MATINLAIQALVNSLHSKMTNSDATKHLTPEEQTLVANAIATLQGHATWEQALVAIAELHLNDSLTAIVNATNLLTDARDAVMNTEASIDVKLALLQILPDLQADITAKMNELQINLPALVEAKLDPLKGISKEFGVAVPTKVLQSGFNDSSHSNGGSLFSIYNEDDNSWKIFNASKSYNATPSAWDHRTHFYDYKFDQVTKSGLLTLLEEVGVQTTVDQPPTLNPTKSTYHSSDKLVYLPVSHSITGVISYKPFILDYSTGKIHHFSLATAPGYDNAWGSSAGNDKYGVPADYRSTFLYDQDTNTVIVIGVDGVFKRLHSDALVSINQASPVNSGSVLTWLNSNIPNRLNINPGPVYYTSGFLAKQLDLVVELNSSQYSGLGSLYNNDLNVYQGRNVQYWKFTADKKLEKLTINMNVSSFSSPLSASSTVSYNNEVNLSYYNELSTELYMKCKFYDYALYHSAIGQCSFAPAAIDVINRKILMICCTNPTNRFPFGSYTSDGARGTYSPVVEFSY